MFLRRILFADKQSPYSVRLFLSRNNEKSNWPNYKNVSSNATANDTQIN